MAANQDAEFGGEFIGSYQVIRPLAGGGMGYVVLARDPALGRDVVIKRMRLDAPGVKESARRRFASEARTAAQLQHKNIVTIFAVGEHEREPYIAMEYIHGETLAQMRARKAPLSLGLKLRFIDELCEGLRHAHERGVVHRDIKPANIIVSYPDAVVKILDFGIAYTEMDATTQTGALIGTVNYMAPEQLRGEPVDGRSDIFAVGTVFYELLSYMPAFPGPSPATIARILTSAPEPLAKLCPNLDPRVIDVVDRCLQKDIDSRYPDVATLRRDIAQLRAQYDTGEDPAGAILVRQPETGEELTRAHDPSPAYATGDITTVEDFAAPDYLRQQQLQNYLDVAQLAMAAQDHAGALDAALRVLALESDHPTARTIVGQARQERAEAWLRDARARLDHGDISGASPLIENALKAVPGSPVGLELQKRAANLRAQHATERRRFERLRQLLGAAQKEFAGERFERALESATEAVALDPTNAEARQLQQAARKGLEREQRWERDRRARAAIDAAQADASGGRIDKAIADLLAFDPPHMLVARMLTRLRDEAGELQKRRQERAEQARRHEEERRDSERRFKELIDDATAALGSGRFDDALECVGRARAILPGAPALDSLSGLAHAGKVAAAAAQQLARESDAKLDQAEALLEQNKLEAAGLLIDDVLAVDALQGRANTLRQEWHRRRSEVLVDRLKADADIEKRLAEEAAARASQVREEWIAGRLREAAGALEALRLQDATQWVNEVLALEPDNVTARDLSRDIHGRREAERARQREVARRHLAAARQAAAEKAFDRAFAEILSAETADPAATDDIEPVRREVRAAQTAAEAAHELDAQVGERLKSAAAALERQDYAAADALVDVALRLDPDSVAAGAMRQDLVRTRQADIERRLRAARDQLDHHDFKAASRLAHEAQHIDPDSTETATLLDVIRGAAEQHAEEQRRTKETAFRAAADLVRRALDVGRISDAFAAIETAAQIDADAPALADLRSEARAAQAKAALLEEIAGYLQSARQALNEQKFRAAERFVNVASELDSGNVEAAALRLEIEATERHHLQQRLVSARSLLGRGDFAGATAEVYEAFAINPHNTEAQHLREEIERRHRQDIEFSALRVREALDAGNLADAARAVEGAEQMGAGAADLGAMRSDLVSEKVPDAAEDGTVIFSRIGPRSPDVAEHPEVHFTVTRTPDSYLVGRTFHLDKSPYSIGRGAGCDLTIDDDRWSNLCAIVEYRDGAFALRSAGNGDAIFVNGASLHSGEFLFLGSTISIGSTVLTFSRARETSLPDLRGTEIAGRYILEAQVRASPKGVVYTAVAKRSPIRVAIKLLSPELVRHPGYAEQFQREAEMAGRLSHPHICPLLDFGETYLTVGAAAPVRILFLCLPLKDGGTLRDCLQRSWDTAESVKWIAQIGSALQYAHTQKIVHGDVKPSAVLFDSGRNPYLTDFSIAQTFKTTQGRAVAGTPAYMSPEHFTGEPLTPASDQFSLAVLGYYLVTGALPFVGQDNPEVRRRNFARGPAPAHEEAAQNTRPAVPGAVSRVLATALHTSQASRYPSVQEFADDLIRAFGRGTVVGKAKGVFLSYNRVDSAGWATLVERELKGQGMTVFMDTGNELRAGEFSKQLVSHIDHCDVFVCLLAGRTLKSKWVREEIQVAHEKGKPMIPIFQESFKRPKADGLADPAIGALLAHQGVELMDKKNLYIQAALEQLVLLIQGQNASRS